MNREELNYYKSEGIFQTTEKRTGGETSYYSLGNSKDLDELSEFLGLTPFEFNCIKSIIGLANIRKFNNPRHKGTSTEIDCNKLVHYAKKIRKSNKTKI